jgi:hypothetical protein
MSNNTAAVEKEIAQEKAETLGLAGRLLEAALAELREFDAPGGAAAAGPEGKVRDDLVARAAYRAQNVLIQRESHGLRDPSFVFKFYSVPRDVVMRIGVRAS